MSPEWGPPPPALHRLSEPQLGENIGACARAMANFGLSDLRLVKPRDGWPNEKADAMAAPAPALIRRRRANFPERRIRGGGIDLCSGDHGARPRHGQAHSHPRRSRHSAEGHGSGGARLGGAVRRRARGAWQNDEVALADAVVTIPTSPGFSSLNLGQAVLLIGYEWFRASDSTPAERIDHGLAQPAAREELFRLFEHLEEELEKSGFLYPPGNRPGMIRTLRSILHRAQLTDQEVRTLRGVIVALTQGKRRRNAGNPPE